MKAIELVDTIARLFKQSVEDKKLTGSVDIHADCSQGGFCRLQIAISETNSSIFEFSSRDKKVVDNEAIKN
jgi:hypothetical protein